MCWESPVPVYSGHPHLRSQTPGLRWRTGTTSLLYGFSPSYRWTCTAARSPGQPCFDGIGPHPLDSRAPTLTFTAEQLNRCCDQFLVTLTVASRGRSSSEAQVFLSTREDPAFRYHTPGPAGRYQRLRVTGSTGQVIARSWVVQVTQCPL